MTTTVAKRAIGAIGLLLIGTACSGGGSSAPSPAKTLPAPASKVHAATIQARIVIPNRTSITTSAAYRRMLTKRNRDYVSDSTNGIAIQTRSGSTVIDSTAFSTNADNPQCTVGTTSTTCAFSIGALAPNTDFFISAYDAEPSVPSGGSASVPAGNLLSTGTDLAQPITGGQANTISISLGGAPQQLSLSKIQGPPQVDAGVSTGLFSLPANGVAQNLTFAIRAFDADQNLIVAGTSDPYAAPVTLALSESGGAGSHTSLAVTTQNASGGAVTESGPTFTSSYSSDVLTVRYDGVNDTTMPIYSATLSYNATSVIDPIGANATAPAADRSIQINPLFVSGTANNGDSFAAQPPSLTFSLAASNETPSNIQVLENGVANTNSATAFTLTAEAQNTCSGVTPDGADNTSGAATETIFSLDQTTAPSDDTAGSTTCIFDASDGESTVPVTIYYQAPAAAALRSAPSVLKAHK